MKNRVFFLMVLCAFYCGYTQQIVTWKDLATVKYYEKYNEDYESLFLYPNFYDSVKALEGKQITITGYFLDIAPEDRIFVLSKGPMSACFFCGAAGPETTMELEFEQKPIFKTDDVITATGTLKLNKFDVDHFNYILKNCTATLAKP